MWNNHTVKLKTFTILTVTNGNGHPILDTQIANAKVSHDKKVNEYFEGWPESFLHKISTTPMLTDKMFVISTTITHTIAPHEVATNAERIDSSKY